MDQPIIKTKRLELRPFSPDDAEQVRALAGERDLARFIPTLPHPYEEGMAEFWMKSHPESWDSGREAHFAVCDVEGGGLRGAMSLVGIDAANGRAELGYWVGKPFWGQGFATEAGCAAVAFAFDTLDLKRVFASAIAENVASKRVLEKIGMRHEGVQRAHICRFGVTSDLELYGMLRHEQAGQPA